jgi:hypothetical protein
VRGLYATLDSGQPMTSRPGPSGTRESGADDLEAPGIGECEPISRPRLYKIAHSARFLQSGPLTNSTGSLGPADTAAMLFCALLASGQINMRKVDGWQTLATNHVDQPIDLAA